MRIRLATSDDAEAVTALARETYADAFGDSLGPADLAAHLANHLSVGSVRAFVAQEAVLVAEVQDRVIGYAHLATGELRRLYVHREFHGRGIGSKLMDAALDHPRLRDADSVSLDVWEANHGAQRFYRRYGFEVVGKRRFEVASGAETGFDLIMTRRR